MTDRQADRKIKKIGNQTNGKKTKEIEIDRLVEG